MQTELFDAHLDSPKKPPLWEGLKQEERAVVIAVLARLMAAVIRSDSGGRTMSDKVTPSHLRRAACIYLRQSTAAQVERNRESTERQYKLVDRAVQLGWNRDQVHVMDQDQGITGTGVVRREGFEVLASEVAMGRVGLILAIEVSRVARNNAEWYRLLDLPVNPISRLSVVETTKEDVTTDRSVSRRVARLLSLMLLT